MLGLLMYPGDNSDLMPPNDYNWVGTFNPNPAANMRNWVVGTMLSSPDWTDTSIIVDPRYSMLANDIKNSKVYKCPADPSKVNSTDKARSYSMSAAVGTRWFTAGLGGGPNLGAVGSPIGGGFLPGPYPNSCSRLLTPRRKGAKAPSFFKASPASLTLTLW